MRPCADLCAEFVRNVSGIQECSTLRLWFREGSRDAGACGMALVFPLRGVPVQGGGIFDHSSRVAPLRPPVAFHCPVASPSGIGPPCSLRWRPCPVGGGGGLAAFQAGTGDGSPELEAPHRTTELDTATGTGTMKLDEGRRPRWASERAIIQERVNAGVVGSRKDK